MGEDFKMQVTPGWCGWVGIIDTDWNRVSYNLIFLEDASLSNYVLSIVAWDTQSSFHEELKDTNSHT